MSIKFKVGDRVMALVPVGIRNVSDAIGTIVKIWGNSDHAMVRFDKHIGGWADSRLNIKHGYGWLLPIKYLRPIAAKSEIHITTDGHTTTAIFEENGEVVKKATARYNPHDAENGNPFSFEIGARYAFNRLFDLPTAGILPEDKPTVREVKRKAKPGEYVKVVSASDVPYTNGKPDYKNGDILKIIELEKNDLSATTVRYARGRGDGGKSRVLLTKEYVVLEGYKPAKEPEKPVFKPYLKLVSINKHCGEIGQETKQFDLIGRKLCVGDTVLLCRGTDCIGEFAVASNELYPDGYVMSVASEKFVDGRSGCWKIFRNRMYDEVSDGEVVGCVQYVKSEVTANDTK